MRNAAQKRAFGSDQITAVSSARVYHEQYDAFRKRNATLGRQKSVECRSKQVKVYTKDRKFHRKFAGSDALDETQHNAKLAQVQHLHVNRESPVEFLSCRRGDDERSYCDSVLSLACSDLTKADVRKRTKDNLLQKRAKFDAIEKWLQCLPRPDL